MDKNEAERIIGKFFRNDNPNSNDEFAFIEACNFLIETENDSDAMVNLGGYYYGKEKYDLAEKYYLMADEAGDTWVADGLGFIYYYGRTGERDYKKAFHYFSIAKNRGNMEAAMKIADMYHNGYGVEKDDQKYKEILLDLYEKVKDTRSLSEVFPEVAHRLADVLINSGHGEDAIELLKKGKDFITQRIRYNSFWGNFIVCRRTVTLLYKVIEFDYDNFDFFDLFYLFLEPHVVELIYNGEQYLIESFFDEGEMRVKCDGKFYKSTENFLTNALFDNKHVYVIHYEDYYRLNLLK